MTAGDLLSIPKLNNGFLMVWRRNFLHFRKTWLVSLFWIILEPLMYLGGIGYGLGSYVNNIDGIPFLDFFFPGLLCSTAMMVAFFEGTYGNYTKLTHQKIYSSIMMTRVGPEEIVFGELLWAASKGFLGVTGVAAVASFFGLVETPYILLALLILLLLSWVFSCIAMIITSFARSYDAFIYGVSGFIIPMTFLSGIYFPLDQLPQAVRIFAYLLPLTHGVQAVRILLNSGPTEMVLVHIFVLVILSWLLMNFAIQRIRHRLLK